MSEERSSVYGKVYPQENIDALGNFLGVDPFNIHVWSDDSLTIGDQDWIEYYVTDGTMEDFRLIGTPNGFNIYTNR